MLVVSTSSADTYITNKFVDNVSMVNSNVGRAGTLDLFKLFNHPSAPPNSIELSRLLVKFDYQKLALLHQQGRLNLDQIDSFFKLKSIAAGQSVPQNFTISVFPLAKDFSEGIGRDVISFSDIDNASFVSSSNLSFWEITGAFKSGTLGDADVDYFYQGDLLDGNGVQSFNLTQSFLEGTEDLNLNISKFVSASLAGILPNHGFRVSLSLENEENQNSYFVKRFSSRQVKDSFQRPRIETFFDDSERDDREHLTFNITSSLYLTNHIAGERARFFSGSNQVQGNNCLLLSLSTGSFVTTFSVSESPFRQGTYFSNIFVSSFDDGIVSGSVTLSQYIQSSGSVIFEENWTSLDETVLYKSGKLKIKSSEINQGIFQDFELNVFTSGPEKSGPNSLVLIRPRFYNLSSEDRSAKFAFAKKPIPLKGTYRVVDSNTGEVYVDFNDLNQLSYDSDGNYFEFFSDSIPFGRPVSFDYKIKYLGTERIINDRGYTFRLGE